MSSLLSETMDGADLRYQYDELCKKFLSNKEVLARILKYRIPEYKHCSIADIRDKYIEGTPEVGSAPVKPDQAGRIHGDNTEDSSQNEGSIRYDIRFHAIAPGQENEEDAEYIRLIINVEAQNQYYPSYPLVKRGLYYCARLLSAQYGTVFEKAHYEKLQKVYSIWICTAPPGSRRNTITEYSLQEKTVCGNAAEKKQNYDLLQVVILCLGSVHEATEEDLRFLDILFSKDLTRAERKHMLTEQFDMDMSNSMEREVEQMCNLSQGFVEEGKLLGREEGRAEGHKQGLTEGRLETLKNLMQTTGWSFEVAADALKLPEKERVLFRKKLGC